jgi:type I restriction enzyme S subunit
MIADLKPYADYKESGLPWLGRVPAHWEARPAFGAFVTNRERNHGMKERTVLSLSYGRIVIKPAEKLHGLVPESFETYQIVNPGDIVLRTTDLQNDHTSLRVGIVRNRGIITSAYLALRTKPGVTPEFGFQFLNVWDASKAIYGYGSGLRQNLDFSHFKRMPVAVPPPAEQAAIVRFLDWANGRLERAIRAKRKVIALLNEQKQAIIHRAVTRGLDPSVPLKPSGIPWLGDIPAHWETPLNQRIFKEEIRPHNGAKETQLSLSQRDGLIATSDMKERSLQTASYDNWKVTLPGDLVLNRFKAHLGVFFEARLRGIVSFHYGVFAPRRRLHTRFFELLFHIYPYRTIYAGRSNGMTVGLQNLSNQNFYGVRSAVPPTDEQSAIVDYAERETQAIRTAISRLEREIDLLREYRTRLVADVVTGKLDVREAAAHLPDEEALPDTCDTVDTDPDLDTDEEADA